MKLDENLIARCIILDTLDGLVSEETRVFISELIYEYTDGNCSIPFLKRRLQSYRKDRNQEIWDDDQINDDFGMLMDRDTLDFNIKASEELINLMEENNIHYIIL